MALKRNGESRVTITQVAREAGVSITTVSKVLNHLPGVAQETRDRVEGVIARRQYVQSHAARLLRKSQSGLIDLAIMRLEGGYDLGIMRGVQDVLETTGHRLVVFATHEDEDLERRWLRRVFEQATDGVLLLLPYERTGLANLLVEHQIPFVAIGDRNCPQRRRSRPSARRSGRAATRLRNICSDSAIAASALSPSRFSLRTSRARLAGYREDTRPPASRLIQS